MKIIDLTFSSRLLAKVFVVCTSVSLLMVGVSFAQTDTAAPVQGDGQQTVKPLVIRSATNVPEELAPKWVKVCNVDNENNKSVCTTSEELRNDRGAVVSSAAILQVTDQEPKIVVSLPTGVYLPEGFRLQVDQDEQAFAGRFLVCANACVGESVVNSEFIDKIKKGNELYVIFVSGDRQLVVSLFPLAGVTKAITGPGIDPQTALDEQKKLEESLKVFAQKRADEIAAEQQNNQ